MDLNYLAFFLISFVPLLIAFYWYNPNSFISKWSGISTVQAKSLSFSKKLLCFILSFALVYGYINLVIHQMGFYELFFTDIMKGSQEAKTIVDNFMMEYGDKHRHFGHGVFHGIINAFVFAMPFIGLISILHQKEIRYFMYHFLYCLVTSAIIGGLISEFV